MDIQRNADSKKAETMWNKRAAGYPRYTDSEDTFEAKVLKLMNENGVDTTGLSILDVGCGSGKYTIRLAKKSAGVTATDISGEMLRILNEDAAKEGVTNITTVHTDWEAFDSGAKKFGMVFCSTTPAVRTEQDFARVNSLAEKYVVYLGFAGKKHSDLMLKIYAKCGAEPKEFNDTPVLKAWLEKTGIKYKSVIIDEVWEKRMPAKEMREHCMEFLSGYNVTDGEKAVAEIVAEHTDSSGTAYDRACVRLELVIWEK